MEFQNKVVIVTGGSQGIGKTIAKHFGSKGAKVVIADIAEEKGIDTVTFINDNDQGNAIFVKTDVSSLENIRDLMDTTIHTYGRIDILINNAGISKFKTIFEVTEEDWNNVINTNLKSVFFCSQQAAIHMRKNNEGGSIVNIASTRAMMSEPNTESYAASKGGIVALTHALAITLGEENITVNAISPGWIEAHHYNTLREIDHTQHPAGRVGTPDDIARACLYLTNKDNSFITGINLVVDGGMTRKMIYEE